MALDKSSLAKEFFNAFSSNTELTEEAKTELKTKCDAMATAVDNFVKSAHVTVITTFQPGQINVAGAPTAQSNLVPIFGVAEGTDITIQ